MAIAARTRARTQQTEQATMTPMAHGGMDEAGVEVGVVEDERADVWEAADPVTFTLEGDPVTFTLGGDPVTFTLGGGGERVAMERLDVGGGRKKLDWN